MFLRALQKLIFTERYSLKCASFCRNGMKCIQHVKYSSSIQHPQKVIPDSIVADFNMVKKLWEQQNQKGADDFLFQCYEKEKDCFSYALFLMSQAITCNRRNSDLSYTIIRAFWLWQDTNCVSQPLTAQLQTEALMAALSYKDCLLTELVCRVFKINSQCDFVYEVVENYVGQKKLEEAAVCILALKMQEKFPVRKVLLPLTFHGKLNLVRHYVGQNEAMQLELVRLLDDTLLPSPSHPQKLSMKSGKLMYKMLSNLVATFKIPPENCPNLCEIRLKCTLNLLMRKKYSERSISEACWNEMIMASVGDSPKLQKTLVFKLVDVKDFPTAFQMAAKFEIPVDELPPVLKTFKENSEMPNFSFRAEASQCMNDSSNEVNNSSVTEHLSLPLDISCLKYIETAKQFEDSLNDISENYDIVGIDSEWKPYFGVSRNSNCRLALLQLAVKDKVYLMDILALNACLEKSHWDDLMEKLFGNPKIIKLGCGLIADVEILIKNHQGTTGIPMKFSKLLDVAILFQKFQSACPDIMPSNPGMVCNNNNSPLGLSKICLYVLGSPLKKEEQFSDWEGRPLRDAQLAYAALDAYCLLQIYDKLQEVANENNLDFDALLQKSIWLSSEPPKENSELRKKMKWSKFEQGFQIRPFVGIREFKVLLDYRLEDLGRKLKIFGADVVSLPDSISCSEAFEMAKAEGRVILASSSLYEQLKDFGTENNLCNISEDIVNDESCVAYIFQKFNVRVNAHSINYPDQNDS